MAIVIPDPPRTDPDIDLSIELTAQRNNTTWFIEFDPSDIILIPHARVRTASGGSKYEAGVPRVEQRFRVLPRSDFQKPLNVDSGKERQIDLTLLGEWNSVMDVGDQWTDAEGHKCEIVELVPFNGYERKGLVVKHGHG
jgi:hypothetical protein